MINLKPSSYLTETEKYSRTDKTQLVPDYFTRMVQYYSGTGDVSGQSYNIMSDLAAAYGNHINLTDYEAVINPHDQNSEYLTRITSLLRNYDIITPVITRKIGDFLRRGDFLKLVTSSPHDENYITQQVSNFVKKKLEEEFNNRSASLNNNAGSNMGQRFDIEKIATEFYEKTYNAVITKRNSALLKDITNILELVFKWALMLEDFLVYGRCLSYKNVHNGYVMYQPIHPLDYRIYGKSNLSPLDEDSEAIQVQYYLGMGELEDMFGDSATFKSNRKYIDSLYNKSAIDIGFGSQVVWQNERSYTSSINTKLVRTELNGKNCISHLVWKGRKQAKRLKYYNEFAELSCIDVEHDYEFDEKNGDVSIEDIWIDCWYYIWYMRCSIGDSLNVGIKGEVPQKNNFILDYGCCNISRNDKGSIKGEPLPYNGIIRGFNPENVVSDVRIGISYQRMYNSIMFRADVLINRMISNLTLIPLSTIPKELGWTPDKMLHYIRAFETLFVDDSTPEGQEALRSIKSLNLSNYEHISRLYEIAESIKVNFWERIGRNRQSMGETRASDLNGVNEMAINQSSAADTWQLYWFDKLIESDANGLLDLFRMTKCDGWQSKVMLGQKDEYIINMSSEQVLNSDMRVYVSSSPDEQRKVEIMRNNALTMLQNNGSFKDVADVVDADSMEDIKDLLSKADKEFKELENSIREQEQTTQKYLADKELEVTQLKSEDTRYVADVQAKAKVDSALIVGIGFNAGKDIDGDGIDDSDEVIAGYNKVQMEQRKQAETERKNVVAEQHKAEALQIQKQRMKQSNSKT